VSSRGHGLRVLVAPDKFKGSLTATQAARAIATGVLRACPDAQTRCLPVADGGDGTTEAAVAAGYRQVDVAVEGPTGQPVSARIALRGDRAVIEMAEASGLRRLPGRPEPLTASTFGTGQLILAALDEGARHIVLGVGGSATTDGGAGLAQALGVRLIGPSGRDLPRGGAVLAGLAGIDLSGLDPRLATTQVVVASDVDNPLIGPHGAATVYGPQKGASPRDVTTLDAALTRYAEIIRRDVGIDVSTTAGGGAAGGTAAGAMAFLGATVTSGIELILDAIGFADALTGIDLVITGEGSLDVQSLSGKAPIGVARAASLTGTPVIALVGRLQVGADALKAVGISSAHALIDLEPDLATALRDAEPLLAELAERVIRSRLSSAGGSTPR
jgi:glycerate kinase